MNTLTQRKVTKDTKELEQYHTLYNNSFPFDERVPFIQLIRSLGSEKQMDAWFDEETFVGLSVLYFCENIIYLAYLVTDDALRNKGYGAKMIQQLSQLYPETRMVIDIEESDPDGPSEDIRTRRKAFYMRNGFQETGVFYHFFNVDYELLSTLAPVRAEEFRALIKHHWGPVVATAQFHTKD